VQTLLAKLSHETIALGTLFFRSCFACGGACGVCGCMIAVVGLQRVVLICAHRVDLRADSSFVGSIEKDSAELQAEHKSLFETANAKDVNKVRFGGSFQQLISLLRC
jgi:hypothetical protein